MIEVENENGERFIIRKDTSSVRIPAAFGSSRNREAEGIEHYVLVSGPGVTTDGDSYANRVDETTFQIKVPGRPLFTAKIISSGCQ